MSEYESIKRCVDKERKLLPRLGTRKIYYQIKRELQFNDIKFGRDKLFSLMRYYGLLIKPRHRYIQTTMSKHWMKKWPNLIKDLEVKQPDEVWVSDITYIKTEQGNCFLNMITDKYSRMIIGHAVNNNMETESMIPALKMATANRVNTNITTIHHSDRGLQYCSKEYAKMTKENNIILSMTENGDPYENALAERMNRTIKEEFGLDRILKDKEQVQKLVDESIYLYNHYRPHLAINMNTPYQLYKTKIPTT